MLCAVVLLALLPKLGAQGAFGRIEGKSAYLVDGGTKLVHSGRKARERVAVVMTGSPRSFVFPLVYNSFKANLIDALEADVDVFVRVMTQDNIHGGGMGAEGLIVNASDSMRKALEEALAVVNPVKVKYLTVAEEREEKERLFASEEAEKKHDTAYVERHKIFQVLLHCAGLTHKLGLYVVISHYAHLPRNTTLGGIPCFLIGTWYFIWRRVTKRRMDSSMIGLSTLGWTQAGLDLWSL
jgi:hypothetical protein